ncbi:hypothetical protein [Calothrix sp. NIES-2100]
MIRVLAELVATKSDRDKRRSHLLPNRARACHQLSQITTAAR